MKCNYSSADWIDYIDGMVSDEKKTELSDHLKKCIVCSDFIDAISLTKKFAEVEICCDQKITHAVMKKIKDSKVPNNKTFDKIRSFAERMGYLMKPVFITCALVGVVVLLGINSTKFQGFFTDSGAVRPGSTEMASPTEVIATEMPQISEINKLLEIDPEKRTLEQQEKIINDFTAGEEILDTSTKQLNERIAGKVDLAMPYAGGTMIWPVPDGKMTSTYGMRFHPILKTQKLHTGIDISDSLGKKIIAANTGKVIISEYLTGYGNMVVIDHGSGISTAYAHCNKIFVIVGQNVKAGETIAEVGSTGWANGPHCHFEVREKDVLKDPLNYVNTPG